MTRVGTWTSSSRASAGAWLVRVVAVKAAERPGRARLAEMASRCWL